MTREERMNPQRCRNEIQRNHLQYIEQTGVSILSVAPKKGGSGIHWTYSIGLWQQYGQPEIMIIGLDARVATSIINHCNARLKEGERFPAGSAFDDLLQGYRCHFERIAHEQFNDYFAGDDWFYGDECFEAVQLIWPTTDHVYPWQRESFAELQPIISSYPVAGLQ